jgi:diguanylate cyclase (GGDEF)-like protein
MQHTGEQYEVPQRGPSPLARLFLVYSLLIVLGCAVYGWRSLRDAQQGVDTEIRNLLQLYSQNVEATLLRHETVLRLLLNSPAGLEPALPDLHGLNIVEAGYAEVMGGFTLLDADGQVLSSDLSLEGPAARHALADLRLRIGRQSGVIVGRPMPHPDSGETLIPLALTHPDGHAVVAWFRPGKEAEQWTVAAAPGIGLAVLRVDGFVVDAALDQLQTGPGWDPRRLFTEPVSDALRERLLQPNDFPERARLPRLGLDAFIRWRAVGDYGLIAVTGVDRASLAERKRMALLAPVSVGLLLLLGGTGLYRYLHRLQQAKDAQLERLAYHDTLTGLPNRRLGLDRLRMGLATSLREHKGVGLLLVDLDNFKAINDAHGHALGDALIGHMATLFQTQVRRADTLARLGGDEFLFVLPQLSEEDSIKLIATRLVKLLHEPVEVEGHVLFVTASIGIAVSPKDSRDPEELMRFAEIALYHAKSVGKQRFSFFDEDMNARAQRRNAIEVKLRLAVQRGEEFAVHYQPQIDVMSLQTRGFEALLRWRSPELGPVSPAEFIPVAEEIGLIEALTRLVLNQSMAHIVALSDREQLPLVLSVNVSSRQFRDDSLVDMVAEALETHGFPAARLVIELTESGLVENFEEARRQLARLRELGVGVAIDDFGTGYSSLSYLNRLPVSELKIDRSFVTNLCEDEEDRALVRSIVHLGRGRRLDVVAEGVETRDQFALLMSMDCNVVQGYYHAPPLPADQLENWLREPNNAQSHR